MHDPRAVRLVQAPQHLAQDVGGGLRAERTSRLNDLIDWLAT